MNANLLPVVKRIIAQYGETVLVDPARVKAFFSDLAKDEPKPLRIAFGRGLEAGAYTALKTAPDAAERALRKTGLARRLRNEHGLDPVLCAEALDVLEAALYGEAKPRILCKTCGTALQEGWKMCPYCGTVFEIETPPEQPPAAAPAVSVQQSASVPATQSHAQIPPRKKSRTLRNVLITVGVVLAAIGAYYFSTRPQYTQPELAVSDADVSDAELRSMAAEIAEIVESSVFEGFDPAETIQHYYFIPISVDEFQELKNANSDELNFSMVTAYATDDGVIKARRSGYNANYGVVIYSENGKAVIGFAAVTLK